MWVEIASLARLLVAEPDAGAGLQYKYQKQSFLRGSKNEQYQTLYRGGLYSPEISRRIAKDCRGLGIFCGRRIALL
jgi:hypothetical protein